MAQKPETKFRAVVDSRLKEVPNAWFESIQQKAIGGTPDKLGCVAGRFVALELKATAKDKPTVLQEHKLKMIAQAGGLGLVVHPGNLEETIQLLKHLGEQPC